MDAVIFGTRITVWYEDGYGRRWEHKTRWQDFKTDALEILEKYIDIQHQLFYTIHMKCGNEIIKELDYYNFGYVDERDKYK